MSELGPRLQQFRLDLKAALPTFGLATARQQERMSSVLMVAVEKDPELLFADRQSLIAATRQCSNHGLLPDGNEATLQVYNTKVKIGGKEEWIKKVQYQPMVRGIINRILRSGKVLTVWAEIVYRGEEFRIDMSQGDRRPVHNPDFFNREEGEIVGVYAVAKMANGAIDCEPVSMGEIKKIRGVAKTQKIWDAWETEKMKVAALRRISKRLPLASDDLEMIMNEQEHDFEGKMKDVSPASGMQRVVADARKEAQGGSKEPEGPKDTGDGVDPPPEPAEGAESGKKAAPKANAEKGKGDDGDIIDIDAVEVDPKSDGYKAGVFAGEGGLGRGTCPQKKDATYIASWFAGYDSVKKPEE